MLRKIFIYSFISLLTTYCFCQKKIFPIALDKDSIYIGEPIQVQVTLDKNYAGQTFKWDSLSPNSKIELLKENGQTTINNSNVLIFTITSFDTGKITIPALTLFPNTQTQTASFYVKSVYIDSLSEYKDIKPISEADKDATDYRPYFVGAGIFVFLSLLFLYFKYKLKQKKHQTPVILHAYAEAIKKLSKLEKDNSGVIAAKNLFHSLDTILKKYLLQKALIKNDTFTNEELKLFLQDVLQDKELKNKQLQMLQLSNVVQYAKFIPDSDLCKQAIAVYKSTITSIENNNNVL